MNKKSQINIFDLFAALAITVILFTAIILAWNKFSISLNEKTKEQELLSRAYQISDILLTSQGNPSNWEDYNSVSINSLGLAFDDRIISSRKLSKFVQLDYNNDIKRLLKIPDNNIFFNFTFINKTYITHLGGPVPTDRKVIFITRLIQYNETVAKMEMALWE